MKKLFLLLCIIAISNKTFGQAKAPVEFTFCHSKENNIFLDSLSKCVEIVPVDKNVSILSYIVSFEVTSTKELKKFTILGSQFNKALLDEFEKNKKYINLVHIHNVEATRNGQPLRLAERRFKFFF